VGSTRGWYDTPYVTTPTDIAMLATGAYWVEPGRTAIVPGVAYRNEGRGDVMRGEEVQFLGAVAVERVPPDALLCQPGTHSKWAWIENGHIDRFATCMTGEMFALLKNHSLLAGQLLGEVTDGPAFADGLRDAANGNLLGALFSVRASWLLNLRSDEDGASYTSGLLIGSDVGAHVRGDKTEVYILADPALGGLYQTAIRQLGGTAHLIDSHAAFVAGLTQIWKAL
jgi:2-dehydro-3-deoxygalactonokinase